MNFNYGHFEFFWELLIKSLEDSNLSKERKRVLLISPWIVDLPLHSANIDSGMISMLLGVDDAYNLQNLSDVLELMQKIGFKVDIVTLDSADKRLPKQNRVWLNREEQFVKKLQSKGISVWKKIGLHAKMYVFPHGSLTGSVNLTRQGFFANAENITHCRLEEGEAYRSVVINANAHYQGAIDYFDDHSESPSRLVLPEELERPPDENVKLEKAKSYPEDEKEYIRAPEIPLGKIDRHGSHEISRKERAALLEHIQAFEEELRILVLELYKQEANRMTVWANRKRNGEIDSKPRSIWPRLLIINSGGESLYERAKKQIFEFTSPPYTAADFPDGRLPDQNMLSHQMVLTYGTTLGDLRTCLIGDTTHMFHDFEGTNLQDKSLNCFTSSLLGEKGMSDENVRYFWRRLFDSDEAFAHINFARNQLSHSKPLARTRAILCQEGLLLFEERLMKRFNKYIE